MTAVPAHATDLGVIGPVYDIAEPDLLAQIERTLKAKQRDGTLAKLQKEATIRAQRQFETPAPVPGLVTANRARTYYFDPTLVMSSPISDAEGRILVAAGTRVNPLDTVSLSGKLLFFDGRDMRQLKRARALIGQNSASIKPILTGGSYVRLMREWKLRVYFDQQGALVRRLGIKAVPALVSQDGKRLRIDELALD